MGLYATSLKTQIIFYIFSKYIKNDNGERIRGYHAPTVYTKG